MSEIKGQLLGIILVVTIFGAVAGVLLTSNTSTKISNDPQNTAKAYNYTAAE